MYNWSCENNTGPEIHFRSRWPPDTGTGGVHIFFGAEAVIYALMVLSAREASNGKPEMTPSTPSGMVPVYESQRHPNAAKSREPRSVIRAIIASSHPLRIIRSSRSYHVALTVERLLANPVNGAPE